MDYSEKIFEMLGVKPYEEFKIDNTKDLYTYRITNDLRIEVKVNEFTPWTLSNFIYIRPILLGEYKIIKISKPTKEEQLVIDYAKLLGYNWIAKDMDGNCYAYDTKPIKILEDEMWGNDDSSTNLEYNLSFLSWKDDEPYYIGDDKNVE